MKIFVTHNIPGDYLEKLKVNENEVLIERPLEEIKNSDALLTLLTDRVDGDLMDAAGPTLKVISNYAVGFDNVDVPAATIRGIAVTNTPCDEVNESVAEHTWALILSLSRRVVEADKSVRMGAYKGWRPDIFLGTNMMGKTLGIIGLGRIGTMVARRAKGFSTQVIYNKHTPDPEAEKELGIKFASLDELLSSSDIISIHVPLTEETRHMINKEILGKVKKNAILINTARGAIVKEADLVEALRSGQLGGAGLDVFDAEPNIDPELIGMENVVLTPHIASATHEARNKMGELAVVGLLDTLASKKPANLVNPEVWDKIRK